MSWLGSSNSLVEFSQICVVARGSYFASDDAHRRPGKDRLNQVIATIIAIDDVLGIVAVKA